MKKPQDAQIHPNCWAGAGWCYRLFILFSLQLPAAVGAPHVNTALLEVFNYSIPGTRNADGGGTMGQQGAAW